MWKMSRRDDKISYLIHVFSPGRLLECLETKGKVSPKALKDEHLSVFFAHQYNNEERQIQYLVSFQNTYLECIRSS